MQTVVKENYQIETLTFRNGLSEDEASFQVYGQTVDRSYEDRDVYYVFNQSGWLRGEDAIALGQLLIKHGTNALMANMINHQHIHQERLLKRFITEGRVQKCVLAVTNEKPANYGPGFRTYSIQPLWVEGQEPEYYEDFSYESVIYFSPFEEEYDKQISEFGGDVEFVGYDRQKELSKFYGMVQESFNPCIDSTEQPSAAVAEG